MATHRSFPILISLGAGCLLAAGSLWLVGTQPQTALAAPKNYFASQSGSGTTCSQGQPCTLRTAVGKAVGGDSVYVRAGTYTGTGGAVITITQSVKLYGGWNGASSGAIVRDPAAYPTTLDGQNQRRVIYMTGSITPLLDGFTITKGNATYAPVGPGYGGGIFGNGAAPTITNNHIENNLANSLDLWGLGGGVSLENPFSSVTITGNVVASNVTNSNYEGKGGGLCIRGWPTNKATITDNIFQGNVAGQTGNSQGGALYLENTTAYLHNNILQENQAGTNNQGFGGAICNQFGALVLDGNTVISNTAEFGALTFQQNHITLTNNIVSLNSGGGVLAIGGGGTSVVGVLAHNTIVQNGSEGVSLDSAGYATLTLTNNLISGHTTGIYAYPDTNNSNIVNATYTLFYANTTNTSGSTINSTHAITGRNPILLTYAGRYYRLGCSSPAINAGTPAAGLTTDIDGELRNDGFPDIGADEFSGECTYLPLVRKN